jgi:uncharacterized protein DUF2442
MYWDVVEVNPEPDYCLFIRFKDGLAGRVHLPKDKLTGTVSPLLDEHFFKQVSIDNGAVSWPGEIDLAPTQCTPTSPANTIRRSSCAKSVETSEFPPNQRPSGL